VEKTAQPINREEQARHLRRVARLTIWIPFILGFVALIAMTTAAALLPSEGQTSLVANCMTILVLCPGVLCLLPIYLLFVAAAYGMDTLNRRISEPMMSLERFTQKVAQRTENVSERAARASITLNAQFASIDKAVLSIFDRPTSNGSTDEQSESDTGKVE